MKQQLSKQQQQQQQQGARVVFFGAAETGKSSLIRRFLGDSFDSGYQPTVEELHRFSCGADAADDGGDCAEFILDVLDTAGSYSFPAMRRLAVRSGNVFVLVFSVGERDSFEEVARIREEILLERATMRDERISNGGAAADAAAAAASPPTPPRVIVVGAKADREGGPARAVTKEEAACVVELDWGHRYMEASAKDGAGVMELFEEVVRMVKGPNRDLRLSAEARRAQFRKQARPQQQKKKNHHQQQGRKEQPQRMETFPRDNETRAPSINKANSCSIC